MQDQSKSANAKKGEQKQWEKMVLQPQKSILVDDSAWSSEHSDPDLYSELELCILWFLL